MSEQEIQPVQDIGEMVDEIAARADIQISATIKVEEALVRPIIGALVFLERTASASIADLDIRERIQVAAMNMRRAVYFGDEEANRPEAGLAALIHQEEHKQAGEKLGATAGRLSPGFARLTRITATLTSDLSFLYEHPDLADSSLRLALADPAFSEQFRSVIDSFMVLIDYAEGMVSSMLFMAAQASSQVSGIVIEDRPQAIIDIGRSRR